MIISIPINSEMESKSHESKAKKARPFADGSEETWHLPLAPLCFCTSLVCFFDVMQNANANAKLPMQRERERVMR